MASPPPAARASSSSGRRPGLTSRTSPDGINDGSGEADDSFLNIAGTDASENFSTLAGIGDFPAKAERVASTRSTRPSTTVRRHRLCEHRLRVRQVVILDGHQARGPQDRRPGGHRGPSARDAATGQQFTTVLGKTSVRQERRHQPEDHLDLRVRSRWRRQGRLGVQGAGRLRRAGSQAKLTAGRGRDASRPRTRDPGRQTHSPEAATTTTLPASPGVVDRWRQARVGPHVSVAALAWSSRPDRAPAGLERADHRRHLRPRGARATRWSTGSSSSSTSPTATCSWSARLASIVVLSRILGQNRSSSATSCSTPPS